MIYSRDADRYLSKVTWTEFPSLPLKNCFITSGHSFDGVGAQVHCRLSLMLFAQHMKLSYLHTPFTYFERPEPGYNSNLVEAWEKFFNLGIGEYSFNNINLSDLQRGYIDPINIHNAKWNDNTVYEVKHGHLFGDSFPHLYENMLAIFRKKYYSSEKPALRFFSPSKVNIALHIRRGDVVEKNGSLRHPHRYTPNSIAISNVKLVLSALDSLGVDKTVHLFSDGDNVGFEEFSSIGVEVHVASSTFETFHHLVSADILLMAKSSFSYTAALLSAGVKIYERFWHKPLPDWIVVDTNSAHADRSKIRDEVIVKLSQKRLNNYNA